MKHILVVEDEKEISELIKTFLEVSDYRVTVAEDGNRGLKLFKETHPDLVLLDIMLPGIDGYEVCKEIRKEADTPVIMLTALADEEEQIRGYELGIDEYVTKPFSIHILLKKVEAVMRRNNPDITVLTYKNLEINRKEYRAFMDGKEVFLTRTEFDILALFASDPHRVFTKESLIRFIWKYDYNEDEQIIYTHIKNIRKKLGTDIIKTIRGVGYKLD